jgi:hypothetical protein
MIISAHTAMTIESFYARIAPLLEETPPHFEDPYGVSSYLDSYMSGGKQYANSHVLCSNCAHIIWEDCLKKDPQCAVIDYDGSSNDTQYCEKCCCPLDFVITTDWIIDEIESFETSGIYTSFTKEDIHTISKGLQKLYNPGYMDEDFTEIYLDLYLKMAHLSVDAYLASVKIDTPPQTKGC